MINTVDHNISIDLGLATSTTQAIRIKEYDANSHKFIFTISENGTAYDITGLSARVYFVKGDGTKVYQDCTLDTPASGIISTILTTQCLTCPGFVSCELTIYGDAGELLTSASFIFYVLDLDRDDAAIESTSEFTSLTTLIVTAGQHETRIDAFEAVNGVIKGNGAGVFTAANATDLPITDTGNYFTTDNAGAALQETGAQLAEIMKYPCAKVYNNANLSIPNEALTLIALNSEIFDTDTMHDNTTNNSRITCKTAGKYYVSGQIEFVSNSTGVRGLYLRKNDEADPTNYIAQIGANAVSNGQTKLIISTIINLTVNDYVELLAYQNSGGALQAITNGYSLILNAVKVG